MQPVLPPSHDQLRAVGQKPLLKVEVYFGAAGTMNFDSGSIEPQVGEILTGATSGATAVVFLVTKTGGIWGDGDASGYITLLDCNECFNNNEDIDGNEGGANILTVDHPDGAVGVDKIVKNGAFVATANDWTAIDCALASVAGGQVTNCLRMTRTGANWQAAWQAITLTTGRRYRLEFYVKSGTSGNESFYVGVVQQGVAWHDRIEGTTTGAWVKHTLTFEADALTDAIQINKNTATAGTMLFDEITIYELNAWVNLCALGGKNYVEDVSISLGGAGMTPNPVGGSLTVTLSNEDSIFHPLHPDSGYEEYIKAGRKIKISIGGTYADVPYYWQRIIGYIDEPDFSMPSFKVNISGADYMKFLEDVELRSPDTLWRGEETFSTIASDGRGATEYYTNDDAMDIPDEANNVDNWFTGGALCTLSSIEEHTDNTGDTTLGSPIIAGMTDTSGFFIGGYVRVSAGFAAVINKIIEIDDDESITLDANATASVDNVIVNYYVGKVVIDSVTDRPTIYHNNVFVPEVGARYNFSFWYKSLASAEYMRVIIYQWDGANWHELARREGLGGQTTWTEDDLTFVAATDDPIQIWIEFYDVGIGAQFWLDLFTIRKYTPPYERHYKIVGACNGIYRVLLDEGEGAGFEDVWQGEEDVGWYYTPEAEFGPDPPAHPAQIVWFDKNRVIANGTDNLKIQYFITVSLVDMVADILVTAGLYATRAAALDAIDDHPDYVDPTIDIDQCWFEVGEPALGAIRMICERANYRFFFTWEGKPAFIPAPAPVGVSFAFTEQGHIASVHTYQDRSEIWNRIVIEGKKQADPVSLEEVRKSEFRGEANDAASIIAYGERTLTIKNHLFQDQADLDAMCITLRDEYKDPKWYADVEVPFQPVPLELGDKITWLERLNPDDEITQTGIIRDIKISTFNTIYKCVIV